MSIPGGGSPLLLGGAVGYKIERSLRFNSSDSAYLSRTAGTPSSAGTYTLSIWVKRSALNTDYAIFGANSSSGYTQCYFTSDNKLRWYEGPIPGGADIQTTPVFRDTSAWYHFVFVKTGTSSMTIYQNGIQIAQTTSSVPSSSPFNTSSGAIYIGYVPGSGFSAYANSYLADIHFIDGQALTPSSFAETNATTGQWVPKAYSGSYGTNGFQLKFADNSAATATTLGKDTSGNGNNWTPNNISVTAGAGNDSLVDSPTNYGIDTGAGGEVRGNYATLNPLTVTSPLALANGNLEVSDSNTSAPVALGTIAVSAGKWYWEVTIGNTFCYIGAAKVTSRSSVSFLGAAAGQFMYNNGNVAASYIDGSAYNYSTASTSTTNDVIGVALNFDSNQITFYKNGVSMGVFGSNILGTDLWAPALKNNTATSTTFNFGQRPFAYTAPSGFKALCTANLPAPVITKPSTVMDVKLYTGNGSTQTISGLEFSPDLVWLKARSGAFIHGLFDAVRGTGKGLVSSTANAETTYAAVTSFNSDGFTNGSDFNASSTTYVAWAWDAGSSTVTNTQGSITSQVRTNNYLSIVTYTGTGTANSTFGHGLGVAPAFIITKLRSGSSDWYCYHSSLGSSYYLSLNTTGAAGNLSNYWGTVNSTVFGQAYTSAGPNNGSQVAYCFAPVAGYSSFGSYTGNGSADGPFVFTGMRPRWIMLKRTDSTGNWTIIDTAREGYNVDNDPLYSNLLDAEGTADLADILSNGFKLRSTDTSVNASTGTYVYACFAEAPFALARAR